MRFSIGMTVFDPREGVVTLEDSDRDDYPLQAKCPGGETLTYTCDGKDSDRDRHPILMTLKEARERGYDVSRELLHIHSPVKWIQCKDNDGFDIVYPAGPIQTKWRSLAGKGGELEFKEVEQ